ncbi:DUF202 domain-containing protein [Candidatus Woesearchaeota archaeon]|nr:DUF202 domain-containing protein [Candidatus Woesearchaeota archaeon]
MARKAKKFTDHEKEKLEKEQAYLSNERTLLSFIRTSLTFILVGLGIFTLSENTHRLYLAFLFVAVGLIFGVYGYKNFRKVKSLISLL